MHMGSKADQVKGHAKEAAGKVTDDERLEREGKADRLAGDAKEKAEHLKDKASDAVDNVKDKVKGAFD
jgi:uncharacterized protein YjbJ (UPF0337 family)